MTRKRKPKTIYKTWRYFDIEARPTDQDENSVLWEITTVDRSTSERRTTKTWYGIDRGINKVDIITDAIQWYHQKLTSAQESEN